jgi:hypothetical protein
MQLSVVAFALLLDVQLTYTLLYVLLLQAMLTLALI